MARLKFTELAEDDLVEIWCFIARDSHGAADRYVTLIHAHCQQLAESPRIGMLRPELAPELRSSPFKSHVVFYELQDDGIEIIRVLHGAMDIPSILG